MKVRIEVDTHDGTTAEFERRPVVTTIDNPHAALSEALVAAFEDARAWLERQAT